MANSLKDYMEQLVRIADAAELAQAAGLAKGMENFHADLVRRGYDVEGKSPDEVEELLKKPPTLTSKA